MEGVRGRAVPHASSELSQRHEQGEVTTEIIQVNAGLKPNELGNTTLRGSEVPIVVRRPMSSRVIPIRRKAQAYSQLQRPNCNFDLFPGAKRFLSATAIDRIFVQCIVTRKPPLFRGRHFEDMIVLLCIRWYLRYSFSY